MLLIKEIFDDADIKLLSIAITGSSTEIEEKIKSAIGQRLGRKLVTALKKVKTPKAEDIKEARELVAERVKKYLSAKK